MIRFIIIIVAIIIVVAIINVVVVNPDEREKYLKKLLCNCK